VTRPHSTFYRPPGHFVDGDRILLVHKTYGNGWDLPGGHADQDKSPAACARELQEELGLNCKP
jgi:8-oxo-dGTP diphosphatase